MFSNPITPALELLTKRAEAGELKPRQFEMVARELLRTAVFAYKNRDQRPPITITIQEPSWGAFRRDPRMW